MISQNQSLNNQFNSFLNNNNNNNKNQANLSFHSNSLNNGIQDTTSFFDNNINLSSPMKNDHFNLLKNNEMDNNDIKISELGGPEGISFVNEKSINNNNNNFNVNMNNNGFPFQVISPLQSLGNTFVLDQMQDSGSHKKTEDNIYQSDKKEKCGEFEQGDENTEFNEKNFEMVEHDERDLSTQKLVEQLLDGD